VEGLLCKAAAELTLAHDERPDEAQVSWYLYKFGLSWANGIPRWSAFAKPTTRPRSLTCPPAESRKLSMACLDSLADAPRVDRAGEEGPNVAWGPLACASG